jgi:prophage regulatory protein
MSILRLQQVKAYTGHKSSASIYTAARNGLFTKSIKIGERSVGWPAYEVQAIVNARIAGDSTNAIRRLVDRLHLERKQLSALNPMSAFEPKVHSASFASEEV